MLRVWAWATDSRVRQHVCLGCAVASCWDGQGTRNLVQKSILPNSLQRLKKGRSVAWTCTCTAAACKCTQLPAHYIRAAVQKAWSPDFAICSNCNWQAAGLIWAHMALLSAGCCCSLNKHMQPSWPGSNGINLVLSEAQARAEKTACRTNGKLFANATAKTPTAHCNTLYT